MATIFVIEKKSFDLAVAVVVVVDVDVLLLNDDYYRLNYAEQATL